MSSRRCDPAQLLGREEDESLDAYWERLVSGSEYNTAKTTLGAAGPSSQWKAATSSPGVMGRGPQPAGMTPCTPLKKLIKAVMALAPGPQQTGTDYFRRVAGMLPPGIPPYDGPDDELSVTECDGELCACLPELANYLKRKERNSSDRGGPECHAEWVMELVALEALGERARNAR